MLLPEDQTLKDNYRYQLALNMIGGNPRRGKTITEGLTSLAQSLAGAYMASKLEDEYKTAAEQRQNKDNLALRILAGEKTKPETFQDGTTINFFDPTGQPANPKDALPVAAAGGDLQKRLIEASIKAGGSHAGGGTGYIVERLMQENPSLSYQQALSIAQSGVRKGFTYDENGLVQPVPGMNDFVRSSAQSGEYGKTIGKDLATDTAQAPDTFAVSEQSIGVIDDALSQPGFDANFGLVGLLQNRPGSEASDAATFIEQIKGKAFLEAFETLKGGGQITQIEGEKATAAIARLNSAQSPEAARKALSDLRQIIIESSARLANKTGVNLPDKLQTETGKLSRLKELRAKRDAFQSQDQSGIYLDVEAP